MIFPGMPQISGTRFPEVIIDSELGLSGARPVTALGDDAYGGAIRAHVSVRLEPRGRRVVATGTPEAIAATKASHTGRFLKAHLRT